MFDFAILFTANLPWYAIGLPMAKCSTFVRVGPDLMSCEMGTVRVVMNKQVYLGLAILDLSKTIMYEFHYDYMKQKYDDDKLKLCYMDTDSLITA